MENKLMDYITIPDVGLYLEQVIRYTDSQLPDDCKLTGTMVTNYVKLKIVPKGYKKMYSREQIAEFMIIAYVKSILSMDQIRALFKKYQVLENTEAFYSLFQKSMNGEEVEDEVISCMTNMIHGKVQLDKLLHQIEQ